MRHRWTTALPRNIMFPYTDRGVEEFEQAYGSPQGAYFVQLSRTRVPYPFQYSRVIYIGRAQSVVSRLLQHMDERETNWALCNMIHHRQCEFGFFGDEDPHFAETDALGKFFMDHGSLPVCNNSFSGGARDVVHELARKGETPR